MDKPLRRKELHDLADRLESDIGRYAASFEFPLEHVIACLRDDRLQARYSLAAAKERYKEGITEPSEDAVWFCFESPALTWETLCGRAGWMVVAKEPLREIEFFLEIMN